MAKELYVVDSSDAGGASGAAGRTVRLDMLDEVLRDRPSPILLLPGTESAAQVLREFTAVLPGLLRRKLGERQERRIEGLLEHMLDFDPLDGAEAKIDVMNAEMRRSFLAEFPVLDAASVHDRAGHVGSNKAQTAAAWRRAGRILGLPYAGRVVYPAFQFDADGQPLPPMADVLKAMPADRSAWQRAFWLVSPNEGLDEALPIDAIREGTAGVLEAAAHAGRTPIA